LKQRLINKHNQRKCDIIETGPWNETIEIFYTEQLATALLTTNEAYQLDGIIVLEDSILIATEFISTDFNDNYLKDLEEHKVQLKSEFDHLEGKKGG
jgi:hypothetical protein